MGKPNTQAREFSPEDIAAMLESLTGDDLSRVRASLKSANDKALEAEKAARAEWHATLAPLLAAPVTEVVTSRDAQPFNPDKPNGSVGWSESSIPLTIEGATYRVHLTVTDVKATEARKQAAKA